MNRTLSIAGGIGILISSVLLKKSVEGPDVVAIPIPNRTDVDDVWVEKKPPPIPDLPVVEPKLPEEVWNYFEASRKSLQSGKPLIVWLGYHDDFIEEQLPEFIHIRLDKLEGYSSPAVVLSRPRNGSLWWVSTIAAKDCSVFRIQFSMQDQPVTVRKVVPTKAQSQRRVPVMQQRQRSSGSC